MFKSRKIALPLFCILLVGLDQLSKILVQMHMRLGESIEVIADLFNLTYVLNPGAAFGIFRDQPEMVRKIFFTAVTIIAFVAILFVLYKEYRFKVRSYAYVAVLAGAVGNMIDRVRVGKVVDFLDFYIRDYHWYTFNLADCWITVGVFVLIIDMFVNRKEDNR
ncbi:MAG: signal peptidase II [Deferribacteraceae bacterium]|jgi:signal peptidase II|nr:signal peptidase II [Deferribacteraceae bacterium]